MNHIELMQLGMTLKGKEPFKLRPVRMLTRKNSITRARNMFVNLESNDDHLTKLPHRIKDLEKDMRAVQKQRERRQAQETKVMHGGRGGGKSEVAKAVRVSEAALKSARMIQGKPPYNTFTNYCYGDGYFARSCIDKFGEAMWAAANEIVRGE